MSLYTHTVALSRSNTVLFKVYDLQCLSGYFSGVRSFAADDHFRRQVDNYVYNNVVEVTNSKQFFNLPRIGVEIVGKIFTEISCS